MEIEGVLQLIEIFTRWLEFIAVAIIAFSFFHAMVRAFIHFIKKRDDAWSRLKIYIGKALQLALEFLIAADIIRTVIIEPTGKSILLLGLVIVARTFLSWSITVEIEGCWPWQISAIKNKKQE